MSSAVVVVGVPVSGVENIDPRGRAAIAAATLLCGASRHLDRLAGHGEERLVIGDVEACVARLRARDAKERAVVVATGDPLCFGVGAVLVRELGAAHVQVVPAVSTVQEAFARAGVAWSQARLLSAHGRELGPLLPAALQARTAAVLCGPENPPQRVAAALRDAGMEDCRAVVAERLGEPGERVTQTSLHAVAQGEHDPLSVLVVDRANAVPAPQPGDFGRPESLFLHSGMITRAEVRAVALAALRPAGASVIWDIGAGSGSIGIEAAGLAPLATIHAVERDAERLHQLRANVAALAPGRVEVVAGEAPGALAALPDCDRAVVGGHGGRLGEILGVLHARLLPGGRLVACFATLDAVHVTRTALGGWRPAVTQVSIARGVPAGRGLRLRAEDPVFVVSAERPVP